MAINELLLIYAQASLPLVLVSRLNLESGIFSLQLFMWLVIEFQQQAFSLANGNVPTFVAS